VCFWSGTPGRNDNGLPDERECHTDLDCDGHANLADFVLFAGNHTLPWY
jgi:hypothetical protein